MRKLHVFHVHFLHTTIGFKITRNKKSDGEKMILKKFLLIEIMCIARTISPTLVSICILQMSCLRNRVCLLPSWLLVANFLHNTIPGNLVWLLLNSGSNARSITLAALPNNITLAIGNLQVGMTSAGTIRIRLIYSVTRSYSSSRI